MATRVKKRTPTQSAPAGPKGAIVDFAVVSERKRLSVAEVARVVAAIQKQLDRDVQPAWHLAARVTAFDKIEDVPVGHWPVIVRDQIEGGAQSFHTEKNGMPYGMVAFTGDWSKAISHTVLEMLIDPHGNRMAIGPSPDARQKRNVAFLVQICDPCTAGEYRIDDVVVSDFSLPAFWTPSKRRTTCSFTGLLRRPFEAAKGGYLSWRDPKTNHWWQKTLWDGTARIRDLGAFDTSGDAESSDDTGRNATVQRSFRLTALMDVYRVQEPQLDSTRVAVESLIQRFS